MKPLLFAITLAFSATTTFAQAPAQRVLSKDELRACMTNDTKLAERLKALNERVPVVKAQLDAIRAENEALVAEQKTIKADDMRLQTRFEAKKKEFNARVEAGNGAANAIQADRAAFDKDLDAYNTGCTGVSFKNEDKLAVQKELEAAAKK